MTKIDKLVSIIKEVANKVNTSGRIFIGGEHFPKLATEILKTHDRKKQKHDVEEIINSIRENYKKETRLPFGEKKLRFVREAIKSFDRGNNVKNS